MRKLSISALLSLFLLCFLTSGRNSGLRVSALFSGFEPMDIVLCRVEHVLITLTVALSVQMYTVVLNCGIPCLTLQSQLILLQLLKRNWKILTLMFYYLIDSIAPFLILIVYAIPFRIKSSEIKT